MYIIIIIIINKTRSVNPSWGRIERSCRMWKIQEFMSNLPDDFVFSSTQISATLTAPPVGMTKAEGLAAPTVGVHFHSCGITFPHQPNRVCHIFHHIERQSMFVLWPSYVLCQGRYVVRENHAKSSVNTILCYFLTGIFIFQCLSFERIVQTAGYRGRRISIPLG